MVLTWVLFPPTLRTPILSGRSPSLARLQAVSLASKAPQDLAERGAVCRRGGFKNS